MLTFLHHTTPQYFDLSDQVASAGLKMIVPQPQLPQDLRVFATCNVVEDDCQASQADPEASSLHLLVAAEFGSRRQNQLKHLPAKSRFPAGYNFGARG